VLFNEASDKKYARFQRVPCIYYKLCQSRRYRKDVFSCSLLLLLLLLLMVVVVVVVVVVVMMMMMCN